MHIMCHTTFSENITKNNEYQVLKENENEYQVIDDKEERFWCRKDMFRVSKREGWYLFAGFPRKCEDKQAKLYIFKELEDKCLIGTSKKTAIWTPILTGSSGEYIFFEESVFYLKRIKEFEI